MLLVDAPTNPSTGSRLKEQASEDGEHDDAEGLKGKAFKGHASSVLGGVSNVQNEGRVIGYRPTQD